MTQPTDNRGRIIAIANQKGGVGKTTLTVHLAAWLARAGHRVIVVDADPQGNATSYILNGDTSDAALFRLLVVGDPLSRCVRAVNGRWGIGLLPGNDRTGEATIFLAATQKPFDTVARAIKPLAQACDYVIVDMPPSKAAGFREFLWASDWVLVPTQLERLSLEGVILMARTCVDMAPSLTAGTGRQSGTGPRLLGIVPNLVRQTVEHRAGLTELAQMFGPTVWPPIPQAIAVAVSAALGLTVFDHAPTDSAATALGLVAQRLVENT